MSTDGKVDANMDSDAFMPFFIMYNKNKLNVFGLLFNADLPSKRLERPGAQVAQLMFTEIPLFFGNPTKRGNLTSLHVYLDNTPQLNAC